MKTKIVVCLNLAMFAIFVMCFCIACDPSTIYLNETEMVEHCIRVEYGNYYNPDIEKINDVGLIKPFDVSKFEVYETLPENKYEEFFVDLSEVQMFQYFEFERKGFSDSASGMSLRLIYDDGSFIIMSYEKTDDIRCNIVAKFDGKGNLLEPIGCFSWAPSFVDVMDKYFGND